MIDLLTFYVYISMYSFEKFENANKKFENVISVTKSGSIGYPKFFASINKLSDFKYVVLFYDRIQNAIACKFTNDEQEKSKFNILKSRLEFGASIIAKSFFKTYDLDPKQYRGKYPYEKQVIEGIGEVFIIKINKKQPQEVKPEKVNAETGQTEQAV